MMIKAGIPDGKLCRRVQPAVHEFANGLWSATRLQEGLWMFIDGQWAPLRFGPGDSRSGLPVPGVAPI